MACARCQHSSNSGGASLSATDGHSASSISHSAYARDTKEESTMEKALRRECVLGILGVLGLGVTVAGPQTAPPPASAKGKLERLRVAAAPVGWDTNLTWLHPRSGSLDKRPVLEFLVGIDRRTGAYIPELAEKWEMAPDGKSWTITLRKGVMFHDHWGEFTAKDVQHSLFLLTQPEAVQTDT